MTDTPETRARWAQVMGRFCAAYGRNQTPEITRTYFDALADVDERTAAQAIAGAIATESQWPSPARVRQLAGVGAQSAERLGLDAWRAVRAAMSRYGRYRSLDFGPSVNAAVEALGGWVALCERTDDDLEAFVRPQFLRAVAAMASPPADAPARLRGLSEIQNARLGYRLDPKIVAVAVPGLPGPGSAVELEDHTGHVLKRLAGAA